MGGYLPFLRTIYINSGGGKGKIRSRVAVFENYYWAAKYRDFECVNLSAVVLQKLRTVQNSEVQNRKLTIDLENAAENELWMQQLSV